MLVRVSAFIFFFSDGNPISLARGRFTVHRFRTFRLPLSAARWAVFEGRGRRWRTFWHSFDLFFFLGGNPIPFARGRFAMRGFFYDRCFLSVVIRAMRLEGFVCAMACSGIAGCGSRTAFVILNMIVSRPEYSDCAT